MSSRNRLMFAVAAVGMLISAAAGAQEYPTKPITLIVPWPAGGSTDRHHRTPHPKSATMNRHGSQGWAVRSARGRLGTAERVAANALGIPPALPTHQISRQALKAMPASDDLNDHG